VSIPAPRSRLRRGGARRRAGDRPARTPRRPPVRRGGEHEGE